MTAIYSFNEKIEAAGQRIMAAGIATPDQAVVFDFRGTRDSITYGPVVDSDMFMAGFWIIEAENDTVAHALAAEASKACNRPIEVRPFLR
jgi:hypothetical protein